MNRPGDVLLTIELENVAYEFGSSCPEFSHGGGWLLGICIYMASPLGFYHSSKTLKELFYITITAYLRLQRHTSIERTPFVCIQQLPPTKFGFSRLSIPSITDYGEIPSLPVKDTLAKSSQADVELMSIRDKGFTVLAEGTDPIVE